ncbi:uncharacterized protein Dana_GF27995 [Drosophila ananassae]|uniref:Titin n=1 Tax=Drosophila ananassae TaxID=7217 RepID=A0A0P8Y646_DROAN|nr:titin [Drosophila ananassae]KPU76919.1 uncharacterized protein Dana_GF27995 [Drosophila ananassae]
MKTTIVEESSVNETIETIATSSGTRLQETIEITNIEGSPIPKQRHQHHHHRHHHHHQENVELVEKEVILVENDQTSRKQQHRHHRQENVEVVASEEVILVETDPKQRKHHRHHHKQKSSPPPPLPETSPPFLTPTEEESFSAVWEPQAFWNQPNSSPSTDLDLDTTSTSDEFSTVIWQTETQETTYRASQKNVTVVQEEIVVKDVDPPAYAPPQLQVQTGFFPASQQPPLSPIAEVVQTEIVSESVATSPVPEPSVNYTISETVKVLHEPDAIPPPGFVARLVENIEGVAALNSSQAPLPKGFFARTGFTETVVEDIEVTGAQPPIQDSVEVITDLDSPFLLPENGFGSEETVVEVETDMDSPFLLPANGFESEPEIVEEKIEVIQVDPVVQIPPPPSVPAEGVVESIVESIEVVKVEDDPPFQLPVENVTQPGQVESIVESIEVTSEVDIPLRSSLQNDFPSRSGFVESIVENFEEVQVEEVVIPEATISISQPGLVETLVENIEETTEVEAPPLPVSLPPQSQSGFVETIVENIEVTDANPPIQPPLPLNIPSQTGFVETIVEQIEVPEPPESIVEEIEIRTTAAPLPVTTDFLPRSSLVQELVVESLEVTPTPSPPPEPFPYMSRTILRESLIEADPYVEVEELTPYYTAPQSPTVDVASLSEAEAYVEIIEVTPTNSPPRRPSVEVGIVPRPSLAETAIFVESVETTPTPSPPQSPPLKLKIPPPKPPLSEVIIESVEVTPVPDVPVTVPPPKTLNNFILTDLVIDGVAKVQGPSVEIVEREIIVEGSRNGTQSESIVLTEEIIQQPPTPAEIILVGEVSDQNTDKAGKRYSLSAALAGETNLTQEPAKDAPGLEKRDLPVDPPKKRCCPCRCTIA